MSSRRRPSPNYLLISVDDAAAKTTCESLLTLKGQGINLLDTHPRRTTQDQQRWSQEEDFFRKKKPWGARISCVLLCSFLFEHRQQLRLWANTLLSCNVKTTQYSFSVSPFILWLFQSFLLLDSLLGIHSSSLRDPSGMLLSLMNSREVFGNEQSKQRGWHCKTSAKTLQRPAAMFSLHGK